MFIKICSGASLTILEYNINKEIKDAEESNYRLVHTGYAGQGINRMYVTFLFFELI